MRKKQILLFSCLAAFSLGLGVVSGVGQNYKTFNTRQVKAEGEVINVGRLGSPLKRASGAQNHIYAHCPLISGYEASWAYNLVADEGDGYMLRNGVDITNTGVMRYTDALATQSRFWINMESEAEDGEEIVVGGKWTRKEDGLHVNITRTAFKYNKASGNWNVIYDDADLEDYAKVTIGDLNYGKGPETIVASGTETVDKTSTAAASQYYVGSNTTNSVAFKFTYRIDGTDNFDTSSGRPDDNRQFNMFFRTPTNSGWFGYKICVLQQWGAEGKAVIVCAKNEPGDKYTKFGEIQAPIYGQEATIEVDVIDLKCEPGKTWFCLRVNGDVEFQTITDTVEAFNSNCITMYSSGSKGEGKTTTLGSARPEGFYDNVRSIGRIKAIHQGNPNQLYFRAMAEDSFVPYKTDWSIKSTVYSGTFTMNGTPFTPGDLVKYSEKDYYFCGMGEPAVDDVLTIGGTFKSYVDGNVTLWKIEESSFKWDGTQWNDVNPDRLVDSSKDALPEDSYIRNVGLKNPDGTKSSIKNFDQTADTLVYKKDGKNNTGLYFTSSNTDKNSEVRFYMPDNGYKSETKGYAVRKVSFDYILNDSNTVVGTEGGTSLDANGYFTTVESSTTTSYMIQYMDKDSSSYFCFPVTLINDGVEHTLELSIPYSCVSGFNVKLFKFNGDFFISNIKVDRLEYNANLDALVHDKLMMYAYTSGNKCADYYPAAKAAYNALTVAEKTLFTTEAAYASAYARLVAWATANNDVASESGIQHISNVANNNSSLTVVIASMAMIVLAGTVIYRRKLHK